MNALRFHQLLSLLSLCVSAMAASAQAPMLSAPQALQAMSEQQLLLIDVRTPAEWRASGLPAGAQAISIQQSAGARAFYDAVLAAADGDETRPIAVICASSVRSGRAQRILVENGFTQVFTVAEGMQGSRFGPGWLGRGLQVERCSAGG